MVRQELQCQRLRVCLEAVDLDAALVINVHVLLLGGGEEHLVVQEHNVARRLGDLLGQLRGREGTGFLSARPGEDRNAGVLSGRPGREGVCEPRAEVQQLQLLHHAMTSSHS